MSTVAKRLGMTWNTAKKYIEASPAAVQAMINEKETVLDIAEGVIHKALKQNDAGTAKWLLSVKARERGFSEKQEISLTTPLPITINIIGVEPDKS